ncbi:MAG: hypothetical protein ACQESE_00770 [Nanobdellota archaeon]
MKHINPAPRAMIVILISIVVLATSASAMLTKTTTLYGENVSFTPLIGSIECNESVTSVFHVQRDEYYSGIDPLTIHYTQRLKENNTLLQEIIVEKTINKYSEANTGEVVLEKKGMYELSISIEQNETNETISWIVESPCQGAASNNSSNETLTNTSEIENGQEELNTTVNTTVNETDTEIETINESETDEENETNITSIARFYLDKALYKPGEKATLSFYVSPIQEDLTITYWIEDLEGTIVKDKYTTTNVYEKQYTFKEQEQSEKGYAAKAEIINGNESYSRTVYVIVKDEQTDEDEIIETTLEIISVEIKDEDSPTVHVELEAIKGETRSQVISVEARDESGEKISDTAKIKMLTRDSALTATIPMELDHISESKEILIIAKGLGEEDSETITVIVPTFEENKNQEGNEEDETHKKPEILNTYTRQKYLGESLNWYVRVKSEGETTITADSGNETVKRTEVIADEKTVLLTFERPTEEMNIRTEVKNQRGSDVQEDTITLEVEEKTTSSSLTGQVVTQRKKTTTLIEDSEKNETGKVETITAPTDTKTARSAKLIIIALPIVLLLLGGQYWLRKRFLKGKKEALENNRERRTTRP